MSDLQGERAPEGEPGESQRQRVLVAVFGLFLAILSGTWVLASPVGSVPDEYMHYKYAYALWTSQVDADSGEYVLPETLALARQACYSHQPQQTPACSSAEVSAADEDDFVTDRTTANRYPPAFYALTGWPLRLTPDDGGILAARAVGALLCSALTALALHRLLRCRSRMGLLGMTLALTPLVVYFFGGYNPQGLELALVLLLVTASLSHLRDPSRLDAALVVAVAVVLALVRPAGFVWPIMILAVALVGFADRSRRRTALLFAMAAGASVVAGGTWSMLYPVDNTGQFNPGTTLGAVIGNSLARFMEFPREWVGVFGHLDSPVPSIAFAGWWAAAGVVIVLGVASGLWRVRAAVALALLGGMLFALAMEYRVEAGWGYVMLQGRYVLPLVLFSLVALGLAAEEVRLQPVLPVLTTALIIWAGVHVLAFLQTLVRFTIGAGGNPLVADASWHPPVPGYFLVAGAVLGCIGLALVLRLLMAGLSPLPDDGERQDSGREEVMA